MNPTLVELKTMTALQEILESVPLSIYHSVSSIETESGCIYPVLVDVSPGTIV